MATITLTPQQLKDRLSELDMIANQLKASFVGRDQVVELLIICAIAQEHLLIVGPPGTAKSELIKRFARLCTEAESEARPSSYFEYLLTRFTEPNELFGPVDIGAFRRGEGSRRQTGGLLPQAEIAFLDEVFMANSAILNALLSVLNERVFYNGSRPEQVPLICAVGASNTVPDSHELSALYDRFLLRVWTDNVEESLFDELFQRGWALEQERLRDGYRLRLDNLTTTDVLRALNRRLSAVDLGPIRTAYREAIRRMRAEGIALSDRRVVKLLRLIAAAALRDGREEANPGDLWVLRHVWNDAEQIPHLEAIIDPYVDAHRGTDWRAERPLDDIAADLDRLEAQIGDLKTDTDFVDYLQRIEALRRELIGRPGGDGAASAADEAADEQAPAALMQRCEGLIEQVVGLLEATA